MNHSLKVLLIGIDASQIRCRRCQPTYVCPADLPAMDDSSREYDAVAVDGRDVSVVRDTLDTFSDITPVVVLTQDISQGGAFLRMGAADIATHPSEVPYRMLWAAGMPRVNGVHALDIKHAEACLSRARDTIDTLLSLEGEDEPGRTERIAPRSPISA